MLYGFIFSLPFTPKSLKSDVCPLFCTENALARIKKKKNDPELTVKAGRRVDCVRLLPQGQNLRGFPNTQ